MTKLKRLAAGAVLLASTAMLSGCLFQPGRFDSTLHIMADRQFTFSYQGEIVMAGLTDLAAMAEASSEAEPCTDGDSGKERTCTEEELAQQARDDAMARQMLEGMIGGANMTDEEEIAKMADMLERQRGWNSVEFIGDGVFMVDFAIASALGHDFDFPTFEDMPMANSFVSIRLRDDSKARISAPGFAPTAGNPMGAMMGMFGAMAAAEGDDADSIAMEPRPIDGTFRIVTDARILANNTDEGPVADQRGQMLVWDIDAGTTAAPTALIEFAD
ncbi:hypothetical protein [Aurantiacibacter rhizosphaerae]|uniref:Lipoprotein n=1 Tax=Aurantiacibacter rhizosphaerae TaxID=2691582 RepID=A0A844XH78_9SPHN|nr:hypothetical protein [Aurantiacibacter rhizosphaerae]MWV29366.1 hypothetical protein [Aurantiacibacter rhizosphaerae]